LTLKFAFGKICRYTVSILPAFIGFSLAGAVIFAPYSDNFADWGSTLVTLYAIMNGDDMHSTFVELYRTYPLNTLFPRIFLFVFAFMAITSFLNVYIFITEDAYHLAKLVSAKYHKDYESLPGTIMTMYKHEWLALQRKLDIEKLFLAIDMELGVEESQSNITLLNFPLHDLGNKDNAQQKQQTQKKDKKEILTPELQFIHSLRKNAQVKADAKRASVTKSSIPPAGYSPINSSDNQIGVIPTESKMVKQPVSAAIAVPAADSSYYSEEKQRGTKGPTDTMARVMSIFEKHKVAFEKKMEKSKNIFLQDLHNDITKELSRAQSGCPTAVGLFDDTEVLLRSPVIPSSRVEDVSRSRTQSEN